MKKLHLALFLLGLALFVAGLLHLFNLRFEAGDNYPPYSSLRADPLGAKAFYDSIDPLLPARRNLQPVAKLGSGYRTTLLWLGEEARKLRFAEDDIEHLETFVRTGGRLVIAAFPVPKRPLRSTFAPPGRGRRTPGLAPTNAPPPDEEAEFKTVSIQDRWGLVFSYEDLARVDSGPGSGSGGLVPALASLRPADPSPALPRTLRVHTALHFSELDPNWQVLYARIERTNQLPVVIERPMGKGSIVLAADAFPFSNEALLNDRQAGLLAWFIGPGHRVVFDETHLGVRTDSGIATLARQYRLHGLFVGLLLLAALFIWKNSVSFIPPREEHLARERGDWVEGKDTAAGFINLLRRNIPATELLKLCLEQWNSQVAALRKPPAAKLEAMQKIIDAENALDPRQRHPVQTYRRFCEILSKRSAFQAPKRNVENPPSHPPTRAA